MGRAEVLAEENQAWAGLIGAIAAVPAERRDAEGDVPDWFTHDVVWRTACWVRPGADAVELIRQCPSEPADEEATDAENAAITEDGRKMSGNEVIGPLERNRASGRQSLEAFDGDVPESALKFFSDHTTEHFREHELPIRALAGISSTQQGEASRWNR
jgi:hypothetical protein